MKRITTKNLIAKIEQLNGNFQFYTRKVNQYQYRSGYGLVGLDTSDGSNVTPLVSKRELDMVLDSMMRVLWELPTPEFQLEKEER